MLTNTSLTTKTTQPLCPAFGQCGGCTYQNIPYAEELSIKQNNLKSILKKCLNITNDHFEGIVASPKVYHYRNRLDLKLIRTRAKKIFIGFTPAEHRRVLPIDTCYIAEHTIDEFIPELKRQAASTIPDKYRTANLTIRTGDDGRVYWGGIGRRSTQLEEKDYLWTEIHGRRIFYSLDTFFQANLSILPELFNRIYAFNIWGENTTFYDLYGGVGFFGIGLIDKVREVFLIEENLSSLKLARHNIKYHNLKNFEIVEGKVENTLANLINKNSGKLSGNEIFVQNKERDERKPKAYSSYVEDFPESRDAELDKKITPGQPPNTLNVAMIDPPRAGLSDSVRHWITQNKHFQYVLYLSCNPTPLARDLTNFIKNDWQIEKIIPFDFFPRTKHLETLVLLKK